MSGGMQTGRRRHPRGAVLSCNNDCLHGNGTMMVWKTGPCMLGVMGCFW